MAFDRAERRWRYEREEMLKRERERRGSGRRVILSGKIPSQVRPGRDGGVVVRSEVIRFLGEE